MNNQASQQDVIDAIKEHEDTLHRDTAEQIKALKSEIGSLTQSINATSKFVVANGKQTKEMADNMKSFIDAKNGLGVISDGVFWLGKMCLALSVIGGAIWGAIHLGHKP